MRRSSRSSERSIASRCFGRSWTTLTCTSLDEEDQVEDLRASGRARRGGGRSNPCPSGRTPARHLTHPHPRPSGTRCPSRTGPGESSRSERVRPAARVAVPRAPRNRSRSRRDRSRSESRSRSGPGRYSGSRLGPGRGRGIGPPPPAVPRSLVPCPVEDDPVLVELGIEPDGRPRAETVEGHGEGGVEGGRAPGPGDVLALLTSAMFGGALQCGRGTCAGSHLGTGRHGRSHKSTARSRSQATIPPPAPPNRTPYRCLYRTPRRGAAGGVPSGGRVPDRCPP